MYPAPAYAAPFDADLVTASNGFNEDGSVSQAALSKVGLTLFISSLRTQRPSIRYSVP